MPRATLIIDVDNPEEVEGAEAWLERWSPHLSYLSENLGCGCCVDIFDVDAPKRALDELPENILSSGWTA